MKNYLLLLLLSIALISCKKRATIDVQNSVSSVKITDIRWGDIQLSGTLLPGQSTKEITINKYDEKLPARFPISFVMIANDKEVFLTTEKEYLLDYDDDLTIIIDDETPVFNP